MNTTTRLYKIRITDQTGHTDLEQVIDDAVKTIMDNAFQNGRWPYLNSQFFQFTATSASDTTNLLLDAARLKQALESSPEGLVVTLSGNLVGGAIMVNIKITDQSGHTDLVQELGEAVATILAQHIQQRKQAYIQSHYYQFDSDALNSATGMAAETARLRAHLEQVDGPVMVTLTGELVGGNL